MPHKSHQDIGRELENAKRQVRIGGIYSHYKNPEHLVRVIAIGVRKPRINYVWYIRTWGTRSLSL